MGQEGWHDGCLMRLVGDSVWCSGRVRGFPSTFSRIWKEDEGALGRVSGEECKRQKTSEGKK